VIVSAYAFAFAFERVCEREGEGGWGVRQGLLRERRAEESTVSFSKPYAGNVIRFVDWNQKKNVAFLCKSNGNRKKDKNPTCMIRVNIREVSSNPFESCTRGCPAAVESNDLRAGTFLHVHKNSKRSCIRKIYIYIYICIYIYIYIYIYIESQRRSLREVSGDPFESCTCGCP